MIETPAVKPADDLGLNFKCAQCLYTNITKKGSSQHTRMKHRISHVDGTIDSEEDNSPEEDWKSLLEGNKSETLNLECFHMLVITEECAMSCDEQFTSKEECHKHM